MSKLTLSNLANLQNEATAVSTINGNNATLTTAFDNTLSRDGSIPNQMMNNLDMNDNQIINLPAPVSGSSPARLVDVISNPTLVLTIPAIGTSGSVVGLLNTNNTISGINTYITPQTFTGGLIAGPTVTLGTPSIQFALSAGGVSIANIPFQFNTVFQSNFGNSGGVVVIPSLGTLSSTSNFHFCYLASIGSVTPVPSGTQGILTGFTTNITTNQSSADITSPGYGFGTFLNNTGTSEQDLFYGSLVQSGASIGAGLNLTCTVNSGSATTTGVSITQAGSNTATSGVDVTGLWSKGAFVRHGSNTSAIALGVYNGASLLASVKDDGSILTTNTITGTTFVASGKVSSSSSSLGIGYATGAGGTVTQATTKATGVTLNTICGQITMNNANLASGITGVTFVLTNSTIGLTDVVVTSIAATGESTGGSYTVTVDKQAAGSCSITLRNLSGGTLGEAVVVNFIVLKGVIS